MKAVSLWQPFAALIVIGAKRYETRNWRTNHRGTLVIHAAKRKDEISQMFGTELFARALNAGGYHYLEDLPLGAVVGIVDLVDCIKITNQFITSMSKQERAFGDWTPGRYAWKLENARQIANPIPMRGAQGLFECTLPDGLRI